MKQRFVLPLLLLVSGRLFAAEPPEPKFLNLTLDAAIQIGYGLAIADVDGDAHPDILLADKKQFVWYQNPGPEKAADPSAWQKHLLAENLTSKDNVCIAAQDIDGDGKCEIAVGAEWNPSDTVNSGAVFYLLPPADRTQPWRPVKLHAEPTVHRMKWVKAAWAKAPDPGWRLIVAPLHGRGNKNAEGDGVRILSYVPPIPLKPAGGEWTLEREASNYALHATHNFDVVTAGKESNTLMRICVAAKEGIFNLHLDWAGWMAMPSIVSGDDWDKKAYLSVVNEDGIIPVLSGFGEVRTFAAKEGMGFVTVEPMHGTDLVTYLPKSQEAAAPQTFVRRVLTKGLADGHALAEGDLVGGSRSQIVVGWRGNAQNLTNYGIALFTPLDEEQTKWRESRIDDKMACEDLVLADLNGDGKQDIIASGRATHNLKIYLNQTAAPAP